MLGKPPVHLVFKLVQAGVDRIPVQEIVPS